MTASRSPLRMTIAGLVVALAGATAVTAFAQPGGHHHGPAGDAPFMGPMSGRMLDSVNATQAKASDLATKFERGVPGVELPQVMLEMQKANVSFRALTEVRNKFIDAYREIMNMPL